MISFEQVTITYDGAAEPALRDVTFTVEEGELCVVTGHTGSGKSTLLGAVNGHVPRFTGGTLLGRVTVDGRDTATHKARDLADVVGVVGQDPLAGFVTDTVEEELAYGLEQLAVAPEVMRTRVEEVLDLLGIADLRDRRLRNLSGGQQQRVAIGSVLTTQPRALVLDEPTSSLDPGAAEEVMAALTRLVHDLGMTILIAEHRLERVAQFADRLVHVADGRVCSGDPRTLWADVDVAPPVIRLGRHLGWKPLPLSVRDARRHASSLRETLGTPPPDRDATGVGASAASPRPPMLEARAIVVRYGQVVANRGVDLDLYGGQVAALMGRNGSGKSSLIWAVQGTGPRQAGSVELIGGPEGCEVDQSLGASSGRGASTKAGIGLVPQTPSDLLYLDTVDAECARADADAGRDPGSCRDILDRIAPGIDGSSHPRDLSEGQRLSLVLAIQLTPRPAVMLLDEPTRGLDYQAKGRLVEILHEVAAEGRAVLVATHDVEFVAAVADRVMVMAEGELVASGPTRTVIGSSAVFAPQVARVLSPQPWLTVEEVVAELRTRS
jgi:energy-coupling factor transporter ATP-binding protein EcfA2